MDSVSMGRMVAVQEGCVCNLMQVWLFFEPGTGGDGLANLLERSSGSVPIDGETDFWRVHRIVDGEIKFYAPTVDNHGCFRLGQPFFSASNRLRKEYISIVNKHHTCVVTSHDTVLKSLAASDCQDILTKDQIKVLVTTKDHVRARRSATIKNLLPTLTATVVSVPSTEFDYVIDIDSIQVDWLYCKSVCQDIGLVIDQKDFEQYQDLLAGNLTYMQHNFNVEIYRSKICEDHFVYELIDVYQPVLV